MADPLSIAASIVGIIAATFEGIGLLPNAINNIRHAPESLRSIQSELAQLKPLLARLDFAISETPAELVLSTEIKLALENCNRACTDFSASLTHWTRHSNGDKSSFFDNAKIGVLRQRRIRLLNDQLSQGIKILSVTLDTATYLKMSRQEGIDKESGDKMLLQLESRIVKGVNEARDDLKAAIKHERGVLELHENDDGDKKALLNEIIRQKGMIEAFQRTSEEALKATVSERTKQNISDVKTTGNSIALAGFINTEREETNIEQNISQIHTDGHSISVAGVARNLDINSMFSQMRSLE
ncbi:hypothetical protein HYE68_010983 [Fusarium pseudograminearum]|nr:hypothetical protein HYE68_010983 [Fusarium pseudograminearum]